MMDGNWQTAVFAAIKQAGIRRAGGVPDAGRALLIQKMHAFAERAAALLEVSAPSSVVSPMWRTASSRVTRFDPRLIERLASSAARASTSAWSTDRGHGNRGSTGISSKTWGAAGACVTRERW